METLLGQLSSRFATHPENLATEALHFILSGSHVASEALQAFVRRVCPGIPAIVSFSTQASGEQGIPDLAGYDIERRERMLVESKFWAGLTDNQPVGYLQRLVAGPAILLFVVPRDRLEILWREIMSRAKEAKFPVGAGQSDAGLFWTALDSGKVLAATTWPTVLNLVEVALTAAGEHARAADLTQLRGLCEQMDSAAFLPLRADEITNAEIPRRMVNYATLAQKLCDLAIARGYADRKNLYPSHNWYWAGRWLRIGGVGSWLGVNVEAWRDYGVSPLWVSFNNDGFGQGPSVIEALQPWRLYDTPRLFEYEGEAWVPLLLRPGLDEEQLLENLLRQIDELRSRIMHLASAVPTDAKPASP